MRVFSDRRIHHVGKPGSSVFPWIGTGLVSFVIIEAQPFFYVILYECGNIKFVSYLFNYFILISYCNYFLNLCVDFIISEIPSPCESIFDITAGPWHSAQTE